jgi:hypothetical protein
VAVRKGQMASFGSAFGRLQNGFGRTAESGPVRVHANPAQLPYPWGSQHVYNGHISPFVLGMMLSFAKHLHDYRRCE